MFFFCWFLLCFFFTCKVITDYTYQLNVVELNVQFLEKKNVSTSEKNRMEWKCQGTVD